MMMSLPVRNFKEIGRFEIEKLEHMLDEAKTEIEQSYERIH